MSRTGTPIDLARRHPRIAIGGAIFLAVLAVSQNLLAAIVFAIVGASQSKDEWFEALAKSSSGYLDRSGVEADEVVPATAEEDLVPPEAPDRADEVAAEWVAPEIEPEAAAAECPPMRREGGVRYGIAVPPRKPVDVPRR